MTASEFMRWLEGFMAAAGPTLTPDQARKLTEKLATVVPDPPPPAPIIIPTYPAPPPTYPLSPLWPGTWPGGTWCTTTSGPLLLPRDE